ncbi:hypothetical protein BC826DRAFT_996827 [Russula brevipes]|nr:hypothetical protein BC826DRAFT_996827 [Russula brevipes]
MTTTSPTPHQSILSSLSYLLSDSAVGQLAPIVVLLAVPLLVLYGQNYFREFALHMLAVASSALPWNWSSIYEHGPLSPNPKKKFPIRTRAEQLAARTDARSDGEKSLFYPGLVNISGTYCFMNSTMQAFASLSYLQPHIDAIHAKAEAVDIPTPVVDALRDLLHARQRSPLFSSREHQDAQELFQLVSECAKKEATAVDREGARDLGFGALASLSSSVTATTSVDVSKGVFDGLTANRRSCCECGYTEAVMHFPFDSWQLNVPRVASCRLEDCLMDYTRLEILTDCICRKCSMRATLRRLEQDVERLSAEAGKSSVSQSKKKRVREARRFATRLKTALEEGRIEEDIKGVKVEKVFSRASTKQAMVARPPPVLALHLNRSMHFGVYASKNSARVLFPEVLDLTPFTTSGMLSTSPSYPISSHPSSPTISAVAASLGTLTSKAHKPTPQPPRVLYRLAAVVCHYGQHSFGHYVCFRRKPRGLGRVVPPGLDDTPGSSGKGWLRASDDSVREVGIDAVLQECSGVFMLYYERVRNEDKPARFSRSEAHDADNDEVEGDDDDDDVDADADVGEEGGGEKVRTYALKYESDAEEEAAPVIKARVVRSVSLGQGDGDGTVARASVSVKQEPAEETEGILDSEARPAPSSSLSSSSLVPAQPEPALPAPATEAASTPSPIPDPPSVDEPPIAVPRA